MWQETIPKNENATQSIQMEMTLFVESKGFTSAHQYRLRPEGTERAK